MLSHGNGPQVGLLALQAAAYEEVDPYPLDVLGAQTEGMIGYVLEQELGNVMPRDVAARHHPHDGRRSTRPTRRSRTRPSSSGRSTPRPKPTRWRPRRAGSFKPDGDSWRRVVPSPAAAAHLRDPADPVAARPAASWSSAPAAAASPRCSCPAAETTLIGVEAVIDKDLASELLAREVQADLFVMATDVDAVYADWGTPQQRALGRVTADELRATEFPAGSMGPKVEAACRFVEATGGRAAIGSLTQIQQIVNGEAGTQVVPGNGGSDETFGVHSEVGRLRKVMVHRPELSLQRLTPTNHDDLLFDDVLWVERAQYEHDQFVARMRERDVEVFLLQDLLGEALAASDEGRRRLIEVDRLRVHGRRLDGRRGPRGRCGTWRRAAGDPSHRWPHRGRVGPRPGPAAVQLGHRRRHRRREHVRAAAAAEHAVHPRLVLLDVRRGLDQPDVLAGPPARGVQRGRHLPLPPDVRRGRLRVLVPRARRRRAVQHRGLRTGLARGRRRPADRQRHRADRHERALPGPDDRAGRPRAVRQGCRRAGGRGRDDQGPRPHASRHRLHDARPRRGHRRTPG